MLDDWIEFVLKLSAKPADFYSGSRKIHRNVTHTFRISDDLGIDDMGFTRTKLTLLRKLYRHEESVEAAKPLWQRRLGQGKYGSVGFSTFNHTVKGNIEKKSKRASVMGPCMLGVSLTLMNDKSTAVDAYYRTTEAFKKFGADLVFIRDDLLEGFDVPPGSPLTCHFANVTTHPQYAVTILPHLDDPIKFFEYIKTRDPHFFKWCVSWTARYLCDEHGRGIAKFAQAVRVKMDANRRLGDAEKTELQKYLRKHHHRRDEVNYEDEE